MMKFNKFNNICKYSIYRILSTLHFSIYFSYLLNFIINVFILIYIKYEIFL